MAGLAATAGCERNISISLDEKSAHKMDVDLDESESRVQITPKPTGFVVTVPVPFYAGKSTSCLVEKIPE